MTGLDIENGDRLLEIACIVTDGDLNPVDDGVSYVIATPKDVLDNMNAWYVPLTLLLTPLLSSINHCYAATLNFG